MDLHQVLSVVVRFVRDLFPAHPLDVTKIHDGRLLCRELRDFLFCRVYRDNVAKDEEVKAKEMLAGLFDYFENHPEKLPLDYLEIVSHESAGRAVCDYLSGMTDRFAIELYREIFIPEVWRVK